jgi:flagellar hook-associated protein 2
MSTSSTSAINLSSLLQALEGSQSVGIDVQSAVSSAIAAARAPEQQWENQQSTLQSQTAVLQQLESQVESLGNDVSALADPTGALASLSANSSDSSILTATASSSATPGNYSVVVNNLLSTGAWYSDTEPANAQLAAGSFQLQVGSGSAVTVTINQNDTLSDVANTINQLSETDQLGVTASVVTDSSGSLLEIVSNTAGTAGNINITNDSADTGVIQFHQASAGADASVSVNGVPITSSSNTVTTSMMPGVTLNLASAAPGTQVEVSVAANTQQVANIINSFVNDYNTIVNNLNSQFAYNSSNSSQGVLAGDSTAEMLQSTLLSAMSYSAGSNSAIGTLGMLGVTMNDDGTLSVDSTTLDNALQNNFSAAQNFFQGSASDGFASELNSALNGFTNSANGAFTVDLNSISSENTDLQNEINNFETYTITPMQQNLTQEYDQAEQLLMSMPGQQQEINQELGYTGSNS